MLDPVAKARMPSPRPFASWERLVSWFARSPKEETAFVPPVKNDPNMPSKLSSVGVDVDEESSENC